MHIDQQTHKIKADNRYKKKTDKSQIIIAFSLRKNDYHIVRLKHKEYGGTKKWNTYTITREGNIFEHYNPDFYSDFMGIPDVDKQAITIVLENMCSLVKLDDNNYVNWLNERCETENVVSKKFLGLPFWEKFSEEQMESTAWLCKQLCEQFNIPKKIIEFHHYNNNAVNYQGILLKSNYIEDSTSVNPLFDLVKFNEMLQMND